MNMAGCGFIILAFNSNGAPYGSITAVSQGQTVLMTLIEAIRWSIVPQFM